ncbi:TetR/AcrR family transcriptional regulator [Sagittula sp. NFXS13]|uniref:TetR/AcrR family transcriptional regulator n=1 Tax=Sagittula sp. NFXS13 TaxID=2819095 RepID=UPI0032DF5995
MRSATRVFSSVGYDAATIKDVVRESGLSQGTFYNYFKTKDDVFQGVLEVIVEPMVPILRATRKEAHTAPDFLANAYEACRRLPESNADAAALIARNQSTFREMFYLAKGQTQIKSDLVADLRTGHADGLFKSVDFELMADAMIALGIDLVIQAAENPEKARERVTFLIDLFSPAIAADK